MAPFTPFFTEVLYQNMRKVCQGSEESIHYCSFPEVEGKVLLLLCGICTVSTISGCFYVLLCSQNACLCCLREENALNKVLIGWWQSLILLVISVNVTINLWRRHSGNCFLVSSSSHLVHLLTHRRHIFYIPRLEEWLIFVISREMVVVHPDADFLDDIAGKLKEVCYSCLNWCYELLFLTFWSWMKKLKFFLFCWLSCNSILNPNSTCINVKSF